MYTSWQQVLVDMLADREGVVAKGLHPSWRTFDEYLAEIDRQIADVQAKVAANESFDS